MLTWIYENNIHNINACGRIGEIFQIINIHVLDGAEYFEVYSSDESVVEKDKPAKTKSLPKLLYAKI